MALGKRQGLEDQVPHSGFRGPVGAGTVGGTCAEDSPLHEGLLSDYGMILSWGQMFVGNREQYNGAAGSLPFSIVGLLGRARKWPS